MSKYRPWRGDLQKVTIVRDLKISGKISLEDGLFYKDGLLIVDSNGDDVEFTPVGQSEIETSKAGTGIYSQIRIHNSPVNPCTITYIPRFKRPQIDEDFTQHMFESVSDIDLSSRIPNIDDLIDGEITPDINPTLPMGNFSKFNRIVDAIRNLTLAMDTYYSDIDTLPEAIESVYINIKSGTEVAMKMLRNLEVKYLSGTELMEQSLKLLVTPPRGELFGNFIYIAYRDDVFDYKDVQYSITRGDICVITGGDLEILYYGTNYAIKINTLTEAIDSSNKYMDKVDTSLPTKASDLGNAFIELFDSLKGGYRDSLYIESDIQDSSDLPTHDGTVIGFISGTFIHNQHQFTNGDIVVIIDGVVTNIGVSATDKAHLEGDLVKASDIFGDLRNINVSMNSLLDVITLGDRIEVPSALNESLEVSQDSFGISGRKMVDSSYNGAVTEMLNSIRTGSFANTTAFDKFSSNLTEKVAQITDIPNQVTRLNTLLLTKLKTITLVKMKLENTTGYYFKGYPIHVTDEVMLIENIGLIYMLNVTFRDIKIVEDDLYVLSDNGLYILNDDMMMLNKLPADDRGNVPMDVVAIRGSVRLIYNHGIGSYIRILDNVINLDCTSVCDLHDTNVLALVINGELSLLNTNPMKLKELSVQCDRLMACGNGVLVLHNGVIIGAVTKGEYVSYDYDDNVPSLYSEMELYNGTDYPVARMPNGENYEVLIV